MGADYIITGALGHLAQSILAALRPRGCRIVGIDRPEAVQEAELDIRLYAAAPGDGAALGEIFRAEAREYTVVIHAGSDLDGTRNILTACREARVRRLVHVGSVRALPVLPGVRIVRECGRFDPAAVSDACGRRAAASAAAVQEAAQNGLDCVIALPSGLIVPGGADPLNRLICDAADGRVPFGVSGGLDLVDVRDAARGVLLAADKGVSGRSYILSGRYMSLRELLDCVRQECGGRRRLCVPLWAARLALPLIRRHAARHDTRPPFTAALLDALHSGAMYSHERAGRELGYVPHDLRAAIIDAVREHTAQREPAPTKALPQLEAK